LNERGSSILPIELKTEIAALAHQAGAKRENFIRAVAHLDTAVQDYQQYHMESIRDGMIQRFEFSFELAWKALKEYMTEQGVPDLQFPKQILQEAYVDGLIDDQAIWRSGWKCCVRAIVCRIFMTMS